MKRTIFFIWFNQIKIYVVLRLIMHTFVLFRIYFYLDCFRPRSFQVYIIPCDSFDVDELFQLLSYGFNHLFKWTGLTLLVRWLWKIICTYYLFHWYPTNWLNWSSQHSYKASTLHFISWHSYVFNSLFFNQ